MTLEQNYLFKIGKEINSGSHFIILKLQFNV